MPAAAIAAVGIGASVAGSAMNASALRKSSQPRLVKLPPPAPLSPQLNALYQRLAPLMGVQGFASLASLAATGEPTDVGPTFEAISKASQRFIGQSRANIVEEFTGSGLRHSSPLMTALSDLELQSNKDLLSILSQYTLQAQEGAKQRKLGAAGAASELFAAPALSYYPTATVVGGTPTPSAFGSGLSQLGNGLFSLALLQGGGFFGGGKK
jgi:hypothetical protein